MAAKITGIDTAIQNKFNNKFINGTSSRVAKALTKGPAARAAGRLFGGVGRLIPIALAGATDITRAATRNARAAKEMGISEDLLTQMQAEYDK